MAPTVTKLYVDKSPYVSKGFDVPLKLIGEAAKAERALRNKPATADEVYGYLKNHPEISNYKDLSIHVEPELAGKTDIEALKSRLLNLP